LAYGGAAFRSGLFIFNLVVDVTNQVDSVKNAEREWHDAVYKAHAHEAYPETPGEFLELFRRIELTPFHQGGWNWWADVRCEALDAVGEVRGLRVLDYGCGYGRLGIYLALCGAQIWGFDLSPAAIETANQAARRYQLSAQFETMDAEELRYADHFFDLILGFGVLHHAIKYPASRSELFRVLKPGGRAVFCEGLGENPLINLARNFTGADREAGDVRLTAKSIRAFGTGFSQVRIEPRHLLYMTKRLARLPRPDPYTAARPRPFWRLVKIVDNAILRVTPLQRYCGEVIIFLQK
jgi:2-polyprenyl-3-methyl-5-hydroxy-6-metoxy-1,4-benzoquinol methylase